MVTLLGLLLISATVELTGSETCITPEEVQRRLSFEPTLVQLEVEEDRNRIDLLVTLKLGSKQSSRRFLLTRADCPSIPALVQIMHARFIDALPPPVMITDRADLQPSWFRRSQWGFGLAVSTAPDIGLRASLSGGSLLGLQWLTAAYLDAGFPSRLGGSQFQRVGARIGAGLGLERSWSGWNLLGQALAVGGGQFATANDEGAVLPDARGRVGIRARWPNLDLSEASPTLGIALELGLLRPSFVRNGARFEAPLLRGEVTVGMHWGSIESR